MLVGIEIFLLFSLVFFKYYSYVILLVVTVPQES